MTQGTELAPVRRRTRVPEVDEDLPLEVVAYIRENFGEAHDGTPNTPDGADPRALLLFMQRHFSERAYKEHRHRVLDRMFRAGRSVPEVAVVFGKGERTVWRWRSEMAQFFSDMHSMQTVRETYRERVQDIELQMRICDEMICDAAAPPVQKLLAMRVKQRWHNVHHQLMRDAGFFRAFDVSKDRPEDAEAVQGTERYLNDLQDALEGEVVNPGSRDGEA